MPTYPFQQVDVFGGSSLGGNPLGVVLEADGLDAAQMQRFARWTNLSETAFVLQPTDPGADYRVRIFTPEAELPFAGHPTLGSAHAWARHTGSNADGLVQECGVGLVDLRRTEDGWAFAAPPLRHAGPASPDELAQAAAVLAVDPSALLEAEWVDNGPGWLGVRMVDAEAVLALKPDFTAMTFPIGVIGPHPIGGPADHEVRAFVPELGVPEDPVTGSLNAGLAIWFFASGLEEAGYTVRQGTAVGANGLVRVLRDDAGIWVAGVCSTVIEGSAAL